MEFNCNQTALYKELGFVFPVTESGTGHFGIFAFGTICGGKGSGFFTPKFFTMSY